MTRVLGVIPARMGSTRFPGKPLARLRGRPMLEYVYRAAASCALLDEVVIATCDEAIVTASRAFGARTVMTSPHHERASDRVAEAAAAEAAEVVVLIQGDEPMIQAGMIEAAVRPLLDDESLGCTNLAAEILSEAELLDPNTIKVVMAGNQRALYFSRQPVPTIGAAGFAPGTWFKQVCVIPFTRAALRTFRGLAPGPLERAESIDMLRFLEHGLPVHMVHTEVQTQSVDTAADLARVEALMAAGEARA